MGRRRFDGRRRWPVGLLLAAVLAFGWNGGSEAADDDAPRKHVLFIHSQTPDYPTHARFMTTAKEAFRERGMTDLEFSTEYLELFAYESDPEYIGRLTELLRYKYRMDKPDVILANGHSGIRFLLRHGAELFPGVPVVAASTEYEAFVDGSLPAGFSGVKGLGDDARSIGVVLDNHPDARKIHVVIGDSDNERKYLERFRANVGKFEGRTEIEYWNELPFPRILDELANVPDEEPVLFLFMYEDASGERYVPSQAVAEIVRRARSPVYGIYETYFGTGIVGGYLHSYKGLAEQAVVQAIDYLQGGSAYDGAVETTDSNVYRFDWNELRRWGVPVSGLPEGSEIVNKRLSVWESYRWHIVGGVGLLLLETGLVFVLLLHRASRRRAERELSLEKEKAQTYLDTAEVMIVVLDRDARFVMVNRKGERLLGYSEAELLGKSWFDTVVPRTDREARFQAYMEQLQKGTTFVQFERKLVLKNGEERLFGWNASTLRTDDGEWFGLVFAGTDVTEFREAEQSLQHYKQHLEELVERRTEQLERQNSLLEEAKEAAVTANRAKSQFLANTSHEIRTPLNAVIGLSYLLRKTELSAQQKDYVDKIMLTAKGLSRIITDILDFSKIEAGKVSIENVPFDLYEVIQKVSNVVGVKANDKGLKLRFSVHHEVPEMLVGDPYRLNQILLNLCNNAVKFTDEGEIDVSVSTGAAREDGVELAFAVRDTGIGIDASQQGQLFRDFSQGDMSTTRRYGGTGLGLAISKSLVELLGGSIRVDSELGRGSAFTFTAVFGRDATWTESPVLPLRYGSPKALLVCDDQEMRLVLQGQLEQLRFQVCTAETPEEAFECMRRNARYDLAVIDWKLSGEDAFHLACRMRVEHAEPPRAIAMVSAYHEYNLDRHAASSVIDKVLYFPISQARLYSDMNELLRRFADEAPPPRLAAEDGAFPALRGAAILIVEDNLINQQVVTEILRDKVARIEVADNGAAALELVKRGDYDAILMDLQMPVMDGYETTSAIRSLERSGRTPIVAMTADATVEMRERIRRTGMDAYVTKPFDPVELFGALQRLIRTSATGSDVDRQP
jgi:PAS domain S-box-containing protein